MLNLLIAPEPLRVPSLPALADFDVQVWRDADGSVCAYGYTSGTERWMHLPGVASFRFPSSGSEVRAIPEPFVRPELIWDTYYRIALPMALQVQGLEVLHASAVRGPHGVVALCATKETGKSTLAYAFGQRGYSIWADDAVPFRTTSEPVQALTLPFSLRLRPASAAFFGRDQVRTDSWAERHSQESLQVDPEPLAAVCVLIRADDLRSGEAVEIKCLEGAEAFTSVLAHAHAFSLQDYHRNQQMVRNYLDLVSRVPVFAVKFATGLHHLSAILDAIEQATNGR